jgi:predicted Zn-dependent peptidase
MEAYRLSSLDNGLRVATERLEGVRSVALGLWIAAGSRLEPLELAGVSHFIEHLLFKGSYELTASEIAHAFDDLGAEANAATSREHTLVNARLLDDGLDRAFAVLADMVARPTFADLDQEREVVLEEVAMYEDSPPELVHDDLSEVVFGDHPLGRPIIGRSDSLSALDLETVRNYHRAHYVAPGIVVAASGHVDHDHLCQLAQRHFADLPGVPSPQAVLNDPGRRHLARFVPKETEQYHVCLGGPGPQRGAEDRYAVYVVDTILGGCWSSLLFQEVREKRGLAYSVYSYTSLYSETGLAAVYIGSRQEGVGEALEVIIDTLANLEAAMTDAAIARAKNHLKGQLVLSMEGPGARMQSLGRAVLFEQPILSVDDILARIDAVDRDGVIAAVRRYYDPLNWSTACIGPDAEPFRAVTEDFAEEES